MSIRSPSLARAAPINDRPLFIVIKFIGVIVTLLTSGLNRILKYRLKFWSVFERFPAKLGPRTSLNGSGSKHGAERT